MEKKKIEYPYLPENREIKYVEEDDIFMSAAKKICNEKSTDKNHPTGAVVVKDGLIIGAGANQSSLKNSKLVDFHQRGWCLRKLLKVKTGTKYWICPGCSDYRFHAESMALRDAIDNGYDTMGADLYLYGHWWCCKKCWDKIIKEKIKNVYLVKNAFNKFRK